MTLYTVSAKGCCLFDFYSLKVHEILSLLECEDDNEIAKAMVYVEPPIERSGQATDEDSDKSDDQHDANLNHLGRTLLQTKCQLQRFSAKADDAIPSTSLGQLSAGPSILQASSSSEESADEDDKPLSSLVRKKKSRKWTS